MIEAAIRRSPRGKPYNLKRRICMKRIVVIVMCAVLSLSLCSSAFAYPNQGISYDVTRPEGREYFPSDIGELPVSESKNKKEGKHS